MTNSPMTLRCKNCENDSKKDKISKEHVSAKQKIPLLKVKLLYTCEICTQILKTRSFRHVLYCKICDPVFKNWSRAQQHIEKHTGDKLFKCYYHEKSNQTPL